jgi:protein CpxP
MNKTPFPRFGAGPVARIAALSVITLATAVHAEGPTTAPARVMTMAANTPAPAPSPAAKPAPDRDEQRIAKLHDQLKITPEQEPLWSKVAQVLRANDDKMDALVKARHDQAAQMTAVTDIRSYAEITEAHAAGLRNFAPAFEALYDTMPAAQQAEADTFFRTVNGKKKKKAL